MTRVDLATGESTVLAEDPDVSGVLLDPDTRDPLIAMVLKDRMEYVVLDSSVADDLEGGARTAPGRPELRRAGRGGHAPG